MSLILEDDPTPKANYPQGLAKSLERQLKKFLMEFVSNLQVSSPSFLATSDSQRIQN